MKAHRIIVILAVAALAVPTHSLAAESESPHRIVWYLPDWNYKPFSEFDRAVHINNRDSECFDVSHTALVILDVPFIGLSRVDRQTVRKQYQRELLVSDVIV